MTHEMTAPELTPEAEKWKVLSDQEQEDVANIEVTMSAFDELFGKDIPPNDDVLRKWRIDYNRFKYYLKQARTQLAQVLDDNIALEDFQAIKSLRKFHYPRDEYKIEDIRQSCQLRIIFWKSIVEKMKPKLYPDIEDYRVA